MNMYDLEVFKAGDHTVVSLPEDIAFALGTNLQASRNGDTVTLRPKAVPTAAQALAKNRALVAAIQAIWESADKPPRPMTRDPDIFPDRPGLY